MTVKDIQQALKNSGFDPGPIDGIRGRKTIKAIKEFQAKNNLVVDGLVGPKTSAILFNNYDLVKSKEFDIPVTIPWVDTAYRLIGTREKPGKGSNEAILGWAKDIKIISYDNDDIPWCGLFVAHCVGSQLPEEVLPNNPLGAKNWKIFGDKVSPRFGAIMVFWRDNPESGKGHVGFYWAEDDEAYHILGGNQSNSVSVTRIAKSRLITARWPHTGLSVDSQIRIAASNGKLLSVNEA